MIMTHRRRENAPRRASLRRAGLLLTLLFAALFALPSWAQPTDMILVLDNSGSMRQNDPAFLLKKAVTRFFATLPADTHAGVIVFDTKATYTVPLAPVDAAQQSAVASSLAKVDYRGQYTNIPAAIERAIYELKSNARPDAARVVVFETDGIIDTGNPAVDAEKAKWMREELAADAADSGIRVFGVAFTENADFFLIQSLAKRTNGEYLRAVKPEDLDGAFEKVAQRLAAPPPVVTPAAPAAPAVASPPPATSATTVPAAPAGGSECLARRSAEDRAALEQMAKDAGLSADQLCLEMEATPAGKAVVVPPPAAGAEPAEAPGAGPGPLVIGGVIVLALVVGGVVFVVLRKGKGGAASAAASPTVAVPRATAPAAAPATPSSPAVPEAFIKDINGITGEPAMQIGAKPMMIGRVAGSDAQHLDYFVIDKPTIGRRHALIKYRDFCFWISDQGSVNGTFLNGERIESERQLKHGDRVRFHKYEFEFSMPEMDYASHTVFADPMDRTMVGDTATMIGMATAAGGFAAANAAPAAADDDDDVFDLTGGAASPTEMPAGEHSALLEPEATEEAPDVFDPFGDTPVAAGGAGVDAAEEETFVPAAPAAGILSRTAARAEAEFDAEASAFFDEEELGITATPAGSAAAIEQGPVLRLDDDDEVDPYTQQPTMKMPAARFDPPVRGAAPDIEDEFSESETMLPVTPGAAEQAPEEATSDISLDDFMRTDSFETPVPGLLADDADDVTLMPHQVPNGPVAIDDVFDVTAEGTIPPVRPGTDPDDDDAPTRILR